MVFPDLNHIDRSLNIDLFNPRFILEDFFNQESAV